MGRDKQVERICAFADCNSSFVTTDRRKIYCTHRCAYLQCSRNYYRNKTEQMCERSRIYRKTHPEWVVETNRNYHRSHTVQRRLDARAWAKNNPERVRLIGSARRARIAGTIPTLTVAEWEEILDRQDRRCFYCGRRPDALTQDHWIPISKGGRHTKINVFPACLSCNCRKRDRNPLDFLEELALEGA